MTATWMLFFRYTLASPMLFILALCLDSFTLDIPLWTTTALFADAVVFTVIEKVFWIESIHRIAYTKAVSITSLSPFVTLALSFVVLNESPTGWQAIGLLPSIAGIWLIVSNKSGFRIIKT